MPAGTITLTNNSATVSGNGTAFTSELNANDFLVAVVGGVTYTLGVKSVESATSLTLITAYGGPTTSGLAWTALPNQALVGITAQVAADVAKAIRGLNLDKANWQQIFTGTGNVTVTLQDGTTWTGPAWNGITTTLAGKAAKGANSDITSLSGLTTALSIGQGGTGATTASAAWTALLNGRTVATARSDLGLGTAQVPFFQSLELSGATPFIDFHFNNSTSDYTARLINSGSNTLEFMALSGAGDGRIAVSGGYRCRNGLSGSYNVNSFNFYWNSNSQLEAWVDTSQIGAVALNAVTSDKGLKKDIEYVGDVLSEALSQVKEWKVATFKYKARGIIPESDKKLGFIANDLVLISPETVTGEGLPEDYDIAKNPNSLEQAYALDQVAMIAKLTLAIQAQQQMITSQNEALAALQERIAVLEGAGS